MHPFTIIGLFIYRLPFKRNINLKKSQGQQRGEHLVYSEQSFLRGRQSGYFYGVMYRQF